MYPTIKKLLPILLFILSNILSAQSILKPSEYFDLVRSQHPIARRSNLLSEQAMARWKMARGGFDPYLYSNYDNKFFNGKTYYSNSESGLKVPTRVGVEFKASYTINEGQFLNLENSTPRVGLAAFGVSVPLAQGLLWDERRAALKQAEIFEKAAENERILMLNNLYYEAAKAYWDWAAAFYKGEVLQRNINIANERLSGIRKTTQQGDRPVIDTLEAFLLLQQYQAQSLDIQNQIRENAAFLNNYTWNTSNNNVTYTPIALNMLENEALSDVYFLKNAKAFLGFQDTIRQRTTLLVQQQQHPDLVNYNLKLQDLEVERRTKVEKLKPKINANYNLLVPTGPVDKFKGDNAILTNNYKWGVNMSYPILTRTERGNVAFTQLKIKDTELQLSQKQREIENKIRAYSIDWENNLAQIRIYDSYVKNYTTLRNAEITLFQLGESTLFLVNSRDQKLMEAEQKLIELRAKHQKLLAALAWAMGGF